MMMIPMSQLEQMVELTNVELQKSTRPDYVKKELTLSEILKFIGVLLLCTCHDFGDRSSLWSSVGRTKYMDPPLFEKKQGWDGRYLMPYYPI